MIIERYVRTGAFSGAVTVFTPRVPAMPHPPKLRAWAIKRESLTSAPLRGARAARPASSAPGRQRTAAWGRKRALAAGCREAGRPEVGSEGRGDMGQRIPLAQSGRQAGNRCAG